MYWSQTIQVRFDENTGWKNMRVEMNIEVTKG